MEFRPPASLCARLQRCSSFGQEALLASIRLSSRSLPRLTRVKAGGRAGVCNLFFMAYFLRCKNLDINAGSGSIAILNEKEAENYGINPGDKVSLILSNQKRFVVDVDTSEKVVKPGEIGLFEDVWKKRNVEAGDIAEIILEGRPLSIQTLRKKILGQKATYDEIHALIKDIAEGRLGAVETAYYASTYYCNRYSDEELFYITKAMANTGDMFNLKVKVADKHSVAVLPATG